MQTPYRKNLPVIDALMAPYWAHAKAHRLAVQKCAGCGDRHFPPSPVCPECLSEDQSWDVVSGRGTLLSWDQYAPDLAQWGYADARVEPCGELTQAEVDHWTKSPK